jgi:imidazolonepropionase-like amidohydrolase
VALRVHGIVLPERVERDLFVVDGHLSSEPVPGATTVCESGYIIPGLVDAHAHLALASPVEGGLAERMEASAMAQLDAGILLVRDPGGPGHDVVDLDGRPHLPRVINAGRWLAPPGRYFPDHAREVEPSDLPAAAEEEARRSGAWAKIIGDFFGPDGRVAVNYALPELREAVRRVHATGARIAIHAMTSGAVEQAIEAGFDAVEHGTEASLELAEELARRNITWVPTLVIGDGIREVARDNAPPDEVRRWDEAVTRLPAVVRHGADAGVRLLAGTDAGMVPHGLIAQEVALLVQAGVDPSRALASASWDARAYLGLPGLEEGAPADLVVFEGDPCGDPGVLGGRMLRIRAGELLA